MGYILALDIGVASVGMAVIDKETETVVEAASDLFEEASAASNQLRRSMRQSKRLNRRKKNRINDFNKLWIKYGYVIPQAKRTDIVDIKVKALRECITFEELYLILYSYLKHRGISYLEDAGDDSVSGSSSYANGLNYNAKQLEKYYPCEIQKERLSINGKYRGQTQIVIDDERIDLSNVFTTGAYRKEILTIFDTQKKFYDNLTDDFCDEYMILFNRKRKYYEGPGNEKSRTDYGIYTTKIGEDGEFVTEKNIFEKLIGKCSVYEDELRAAAASYTAQEYNLLNDLNNLTINGRKLQEDEKKKIVDKVKSSNVINMRKMIAEAMGEPIEEFYGACIDKSGKEIFHNKFETYNKMRKALAELGRDIQDFTREDLDEIGYILTINTDKEAIIEAFNNSFVQLSEDVIDCLYNVRKKNGTLFSKWQSFSIKIMLELIPVIYEQPKEQMTILTEMGFKSGKIDDFKGVKYIPVDAVSDEIYNPVVRRSVRISLKILNAVLKKYKELDEVVIEMPRDRNSGEQKKRIKDMQDMNEKELKYVRQKLLSEYNIGVSSVDISRQKQLPLKLKLWNEQDGYCLYSGKPIDPKDIIDNPNLFEIDHIIPRSISFDDSRNNKVLVYRSENQKKGNQTPYYYLTHSSGLWTFEQFKAKVIELSKKKEYRIPRKKVYNLLFSENITKMDVLKGFINRNINDTSYASRVVLNIVQSFFKAKDTDTKVKVIKGSYTHQMRVNMKLDKNREDSYSHHAVDAMLIGFSQLGYESYRKLQGEFIDFETGEILNQDMWDDNMSDKVYTDYLYGKKWIRIRQEITRAEKEVKYWFRVDKKVNRGLSNQTIRGTREYEGKTYKINKFDIRTKEGVALFKKLALSNKESDREKLLVYKNDRKTFENLVQIFEDYSDADNPFVQYERETGDIVRKYAKKHNGPRIDKLKYTDGEVGSCIDVSHKYGFEKGSKKVILESRVPYRMDVYYNTEKEAYYLVGVNQSDIKCKSGKYIIDEDAYARTLISEKMIKSGQNRMDLEDLGFIFKTSFYRNDIIEYEKDEEMFKERFWSRTIPKQRNYIETKPINKDKFAETKDGRKKVGLSKTRLIRKYRMDILGNMYQCNDEAFSNEC